MINKVMIVGASKTCVEGKKRPRIRFTGKWIENYGFVKGSILSVEFLDEYLVFKPIASCQDTCKSIVNTLKDGNARILRIGTWRNKAKEFSGFDVKGDWLKDIGFIIGSTILVRASQGVIMTKVLDVEML